MNRKHTRYALIAALLFSVGAPWHPVAGAVKRNKSNKQRKKPSGGRRGTPLANTLRDMPTRLPIDGARVRRALAGLAGKYEKVPAAEDLNPKRRIKVLCGQLKTYSTRAACVLESYAETLYGQSAFVDITIVAGQRGADIKPEAVLGEIVERPGLKIAAEHLMQEAGRERNRAKVAVMASESFGYLDDSVPQLGKSAKSLKKLIEAPGPRKPLISTGRSSSWVTPTS